MKVNDFIHRFSGRAMRRDGICRVRTFVSDNAKVFILLTDLGDKNTSLSVTNACGIIRNSLITNNLIPDECCFIEHYEELSDGTNTFDLITFDAPRSPRWTKIDQSNVLELLKCDLAELSTSTLKHNHLLDDIERIRNEIDPLIDFPPPKPSAQIRNRNTIETEMISKKTVADMVERGAGERELLRILKRDLSIFTEIYAKPSKEYICFSEFPVADGFVDFVVFSGRSRMDVILIEVKGADFTLLTEGKHNKFSSKIDKAGHQIRERLRVIEDDYCKFRTCTHQIRHDVENGNSTYNHLLGPAGRLDVDPDKDINIRCVIIGGRTRNDFEESKDRHDFEKNFRYPMKLESWDTWLRKLERE